MTYLRKAQIIFALLSICCTTTAFGADTALKQNRGRRQGPPPEAYTACKDKTAGDTAQFVSPRGDTVSGTCEQEGNRLVLRPDRPMNNSGGKQQGPPPEAYTACEDKTVGDTAQFVDPRGETLTGTCEQEGNRLVLRPDRF